MQNDFTASTVKAVFVHQRPTEPMYSPDSPDGWDDVGSPLPTQVAAIKQMQMSKSRPARIIMRETRETVIVVDDPKFEREGA